jgi:hypothetical protein
MKRSTRGGWRRAGWLGGLVLGLGGLLVTVSQGALLGFQQAVPGYTLHFPADHAAHPAYRTE